jgi:hypothetical protein
MTRLEHVARSQHRLMIADAITTLALMFAWVAVIVGVF